MQAHMVDVFTLEAGRGNPAAVVMAGDLTGAEMGGIAARLGRETTFVDSTTLRYFLPSGAPMTLCGHGTIAALAVMGRQGRFSVSTPSGDLMVEVMPHLQGMAMPTVTFGDPIDPAIAASALGIPEAEVDGPVQPVGAGRPKLIVPLRSTEVLDAIVPDDARIAEACAATNTTGLYPFTRCTRGFGVAADARHFPLGGGLIEEPVTGTAAVALAWYLWRHGVEPGCGAIKIEQGYAMGRPGRVLVKQEPDGHTWLYGQAVVGTPVEV